MKGIKKMGKRAQIMGNINALIFGSISFVVLVVVLTIGAQVNQTVGDSQTEGTAARNVSDQGGEAFQTFGDFLGVIAIVIILVVIVGLLLGVIALFARSR